MGIKALMVGINAYEGCALNGCVNDIRGARAILEAQYGLKAANTRVLLDKDATAARIVEGLGWLADQAKTDEPQTCLFYYSGHGSYVADENGDEPDGRDEAICPVDYAAHGFITDDTLHELYKRFKPSTQFVAILDSCHSGDSQKDVMRDIRYKFIDPSPAEEKRCRAAAKRFAENKESMIDGFVSQKLAGLGKRSTPEELKPLVQRWIKEAIHKYQKKSYGMVTVSGNVVLIAGCRSNQTSADAKFPEGYQGALSYFLLQALRKGGVPTYEALIETVANGLSEGGFKQIPQLECELATRKGLFLGAPAKEPASRLVSTAPGASASA